MDSHEEFNKNMQKLMMLLEKIIRSQKDQNGRELGEIFSNRKNVNVNLCIFTFLPIAPEDMDDLEEIFDELHMGEEEAGARSSESLELKFELDSRDVDFLRKNGIRF